MSDSAGGLRVAFVTLGCKLNQFESDALASEFRAAGYSISDQPAGADICIINGCTVTNTADKKSNNTLARVRNLASSPRLVVLTGCFAPDSAALAARAKIEADGRTMVVDNPQKSQILNLVEARLRGTTPALAKPSNFDFALANMGFHTRGSIKIQDGCDSFCSYCVIPFARGPAVSRPAEEILADVQRLCALGYQEIVLTGVNMSCYRDQNLDFTGLIRHMLDLELPLGQDFRLRISSMEPQALSSDFADLFQHPRLCHSLHLCLQSGSDVILKAMGRDYTSGDFCRIIEKLRAIDADFTVSTDLITGFPGESAADFQQSYDLVRQLAFSHVHVFPFSVRDGTAAASLPDQIPANIRTRRAEAIREQDYKQRRQWVERFVGKSLESLIETVKLEPGQDNQTLVVLTGRSAHGILVIAKLSLDQAAIMLRSLPETGYARLPTPHMQASEAELGRFAAFWNRRLSLKVLQVYDQSGGNPEPCLLATAI